MELKLYDTLTREKRAFHPIDPARVRMYVCGPTVYDLAHIGNARPVIVFDVLFRLLRHRYGDAHVTYVRNITDVDDKINARAAERGISIRDLTEETYSNFKADVAALGCLPPTHEPRATEYVSNPAATVDMIRLIERLIANNNAYAAEGHVLFAVASMPDYGKLAKRSLDEMMAGARVEVAPYKRDPMDFVLWKPSPPELPGWDSPWGRGRPGWHIECSAMAAALLGETFDIHGGGIDLVFPHHENEIAQSRCAFHTGVMANYWMHNGFLQVEGEKMAKSAGNFVTIRELLKGTESGRPWPGEVIRLSMLATHYRQPIDFSVARLTHWRSRLSHWVDCYTWYGGAGPVAERYLGGAPLRPSDQIVAALCDDLNTHEAIVFLDELARRATKQDADAANELGDNLIWLGLMRKAYAEAYGLRVKGGARSDLQNEYEREILDARAIVLNEYSISTDSEATQASLAAVNSHVRYLNPKMKIDGVSIVVSHSAAVSLESDRPESALDNDEVDRQIVARNVARKAKNFAEADRIRSELAKMGVVLKDSKDGTTWEIAR